MAVDVDVQYAVEGLETPQVQDFQRWISAVLAEEPFRDSDVEVVVRIVGADESAQLNEQYRHKTGPTNVLSFPFEAPPEVDVGLLGDLVICAPVVQREAAEQGKSETAHWAHMVIHGTLHLLGYDHQKDVEAEAMEAREVEILRGLGIADPYQEKD